MTTEYDLPPLPAHWEHGLIDFVRSWGRSAIEADRKRRGEPVAWRYLTPTGWHATTDAARALGVAEHHTVEPLFAAPQPADPTVKESLSVAEPVGYRWRDGNEDTWKYVDGLPPEDSIGHYEVELLYARAANKPAEPDLAKCAECGAEMIHVRPGKWQHPDCPQSPWAAEPVSNSLSNGLPEGHVLVPKHPTATMLSAAQRAWLQDPLRRTTTLWDAMLAAAPKDAEA